VWDRLCFDMRTWVSLPSCDAKALSQVCVAGRRGGDGTRTIGENLGTSQCLPREPGTPNLPMSREVPIRCRVAACCEVVGDGWQWSFHVINDSGFELESVVLEIVGYEWGNAATSEATDVCVSHLAPHAHALLWRDDGSGAELRMELVLRVRAAGREVRLQLRFPRLYRQHALAVIDDLGLPGWQVSGQG
jgi:hypothetical protein